MTTTLHSLRGFYAWSEVGLGRVSITCQACQHPFELRLLENVLEAVCTNCGANATFTRARSLEKEAGPLELAKVLKETRLIDEADHRRALKRWRRDKEALTDAMANRGQTSIRNAAIG